MANHPENGDLPEYPTTNVNEYLAKLTMMAGATYPTTSGNHPQNGDLPDYPTTDVEEYLAYLVMAGLGKVTSGYLYDGKFYKDAAHTEEVEGKEGSLYYDLTTKSLYIYLNSTYTTVASSQIGRFLSGWNCTTGKPVTEPEDLPYTYHAGDYYMATEVGSTNYKPTGATYTGAASTTVETGELAANDFYFFDGTNWFLLKNTHPEIPTVVQSTGQSTTSVMSQKAVTDIEGFARILTAADYNWPTSNPDGFALWKMEPGLYTISNTESAELHPNYYTGSDTSYGKPSSVDWTQYQTFILGKYRNGSGDQTASNRAIFFGVNTIAYLTVNVRSASAMELNPPVNYLTSTSTTFPLSANQGRVLKNLIDSLVMTGEGAPTTATVGTVGKIYEDTTNGKVYKCTTADATTSTYTWEEIGAINVVQTTGTSETDVMSQKAVTDAIAASITSGGTVAPTEETAGKIGSVYVYYDETTKQAVTMVCTAVTPQGTTPETYKYTWQQPTAAQINDYTE